MRGELNKQIGDNLPFASGSAKFTRLSVTMGSYVAIGVGLPIVVLIWKTKFDR